ncbi:MAG: helix-turn-helix transcriptional regulator [Lachnospiraceae bacterium]
MEERFINGTRIRVICILALFNFLFLGTEYLFDNMMACLVDSENVVLAQSYVLGASVIGFLLFPVLNRRIKIRANSILIFSASVISVICLFLIQQHMSYGSILISGCIVFILLGIGGSGIHYLAVCVLGKTSYLARTVGVAYAFGLLIQFLNNNIVNNDTIESVVLSVFLMIWVILIVRLVGDRTVGEVNQSEIKEKNLHVLKHPLLAGVILLIIVLLMTCIFATLDNVVTLFHAEGSVDIGQWPRLLLAVSGLLAGVLFDIRKHRYMHIIMYCITLLSVICVLVIETGGPFLVGLIVFYLSAGFFVVFFTTGFMDLSYRMNVPQLWAGIGRAANNLCAVLIGPVSLAVVKTGNSLLISIIALSIFALLSIAMFIYSTLYKDETVTDGKEVSQDTEETADLRFERFAECFALTPREQDVLRVLLVSDDNVQDIAERLFISRAALYRHITSLNEKTETKSRIGLIQFYYGWKEKE